MTTVSLDDTGSTTSANVPDLSTQVPGNPWRSEEKAR
ncbi:hypothetical protein K3495_g9655 [Podosphaera aphanis]|nr:hypothetical protein K3495_g9655 [Podosphaera aphanis]